MDIGTAIISGLLGAGGVIGFVQFMVARHDTRNDRLIRIENKIDQSLEKSDRNELATTRLQLLFVIQTQPNNKDTILKTAHRYFIELDGNGEAWDVFKHWSESHDVDSSYYNSLLQREKERSKK